MTPERALMEAVGLADRFAIEHRYRGLQLWHSARWGQVLLQMGHVIYDIDVITHHRASLGRLVRLFDAGEAKFFSFQNRMGEAVSDVHGDAAASITPLAAGVELPVIAERWVGHGRNLGRTPSPGLEVITLIHAGPTAATDSDYNWHHRGPLDPIWERLDEANRVMAQCFGQRAGWQPQ